MAMVNFAFVSCTTMYYTVCRTVNYLKVNCGSWLVASEVALRYCTTESKSAGHFPVRTTFAQFNTLYYGVLISWTTSELHAVREGQLALPALREGGSDTEVAS